MNFAFCPSKNFEQATLGVILFLLSCTSLFAEIGSGVFEIPSTPPETTITANSMHLLDGVVTLEGNVRGIRDTDVLTCGKAFINREEGWVLASFSPRLFRKESVFDKKLVRETTLDALNILWSQKDDTISASPAVTLKVEERSWDLATYSWVIVSSDAMEGFRDSNKLRFYGNVRIKDKTHFGHGEKLDYEKASSTVVLSGNAQIEMEEWSPKENKMVKKIISGQQIRYNFDSKESSSE